MRGVLLEIFKRTPLFCFISMYCSDKYFVACVKRLLLLIKRTPFEKLLLGFGFLLGRQDLFLGFLLNRNVKVSAYVPSQIVAADMDMATGNDITTTTAIEKSFADNALTLNTVGGAVSQGQGLYTNTVVVKYKNK